ncbi:hypothetical protein BMF94_3485 [Rhodotorula taiwanensis]|uniref:Enoyl reductase (ER) domain-containing protein n=1 Tax=Rhodotorula taiwanensis TaxID=741276 RepID=A0A2S5B9U9_9BASI|nr:hypothetical protein BMF94_3485 [Rhodotorula taiwanensis]
MSDLKFRGYAIKDEKKWTEFEVIDFEPMAWREDLIDIEIEYCGVCSSDVHTITGGWGEPFKPLVSGHEAAGIARKVGSNVKSIKVGDRVVVGAQVDACGSCRACESNNENYCAEQIDTYNAKSKDGKVTQGGYSTAIRAPEQFTFKVPDELPLEDAAPMACGGLTVYSPMRRAGVKQGSKVGVAGLGGLGHFAVQFAVAMGAEVTVFTHQKDKIEDAKKMGATHAVLTSEKDWQKPFAQKLDYIVCTIDNADAVPFSELISCLWVNGTLHFCSMPDSSLPQFKTQDLAANGASIAVNHIGSKVEAEEMYRLAAEKGVRAWKQIVPMKDVSKAVQGVHDNKVRYRYVLKQDLQ